MRPGSRQYHSPAGSGGGENFGHGAAPHRPTGPAAFEVDDLQGILDRLAADGYRPVGGVGQYEGMWRMTSVRGPEGILVSLAERIT
jgi:hypothetical protein